MHQAVRIERTRWRFAEKLFPRDVLLVQVRSEQRRPRPLRLLPGVLRCICMVDRGDLPHPIRVGEELPHVAHVAEGAGLMSDLHGAL